MEKAYSAKIQLSKEKEAIPDSRALTFLIHAYFNGNKCYPKINLNFR